MKTLPFYTSTKSNILDFHDELDQKILNNRKRKRDDQNDEKNKKLKVSESKFIFTSDCDCFTIITPTIRYGGLYLGKKEIASDLKRIIEYNITSIINCASEIPNYFEKVGINYKKLKLIDSIESYIYDYFEDCSLEIYTSLSKGQSVLVHCKEGKSRSVSIVIAFLMRFMKINLKGCLKLLKTKNVVIGINAGFQRSLMDYEIKLFGKNSVNFFPKRRSNSKDNNFEIGNQKVIYHYFEPKLFINNAHRLIKEDSEMFHLKKSPLVQKLITSYFKK